MKQSQLILESALKTKHIITVEEHNVVGGLATVVAEILAGNGSFRIAKLGLEDSFAESGTPDELLEHYGLKSANIVKTASGLLS